MKRKEILKAGGLLSLIGISFIVAILFMSQTTNMILEPEIRESEVEEMATIIFILGEVGGPTTNTTGGSCVLNVSVLAVNSNNFNENITYNATDWFSMNTAGHDDITNNSHIGLNVPYNTPFMIQTKVKWNRTHAYNDTAGSSPSWVNDWVRGNATCSGVTPAIAANTAMAEYNISGNTDTGYDGFVYYYYVMNNSGAGYTISRGENVTSFAVTFKYYG